MKTHNPTSKANDFRFAAWHRRGMTHWRTWEQFDAALRRRLRRVFSRRLASGGSVIECFSIADNDIQWRTGENCFTAPAKDSPDYLAEHVASRVVGFGWKVRLA